MLTFPNLPTDNLYKFQATAGLVATLFGATVIVVTAQRWETFRAAFSIKDAHFESVRIQAGEAHHRTDSLLNVYRASTDTLGVLVHELGQHPTLAAAQAALADTIRVRSRQSQLDSAVHSMDVLAKALQDTSASLQQMVDQSRQAVDWDEKAVYGSMALMIVGLVVAINGFYNWQTRVQDYHDAILRREAARQTENRKAVFE